MVHDRVHGSKSLPEEQIPWQLFAAHDLDTREESTSTIVEQDKKNKILYI